MKFSQVGEAYTSVDSMKNPKKIHHALNNGSDRAKRDWPGYHSMVRIRPAQESKAMPKLSLAVPSKVNPPATAKRPSCRTLHGARLKDDYAWLKADNWLEVLRNPKRLEASILAVLKGENAYARAVLAPSKSLRARLFKEMKGRILENDSEVPLPDGPWLYYSRFEEGGEHPLFCRVGRNGGDEEVLLNGDTEARGKNFFEIGQAKHSPDHKSLAWSADCSGSELHTIVVRDLIAGRKDLEPEDHDLIQETDGSLVWMLDSSAFYYVRCDAQLRPAEVFRHRIGCDPTTDERVFATQNPGLFLQLRRCQSGRFAVIKTDDHDSSEVHLLDLSDIGAKPSVVEPRSPGLRYDVEHHGDRLFIRTNADKAEDFKIVSAPLSDPKQSSWTDEVPHRLGHMIASFAVFPAHLVRIERVAGLPRIIVRSTETGDEYSIAFEEEAYSLGLEERLEYDTGILRFMYSSMATPWETYDFNLTTRERKLCKRQVIPSGHDPSRYETRRLFATAEDGEQVPISLLFRKGLRLDQTAPLLLYGYGAYGTHVPASFSANRLSLVDRGYVYALAHVRGGADKGWHWYTDGKLNKKRNSFLDFVCAAKHLVDTGFTTVGRIVASGCSAGGMLVAAAVNLAPELFAGVIADVPFVDVLNTMLDPSLPLTPPEWLEWGNPITDITAFREIQSYSPYDNIEAKPYPPILALGGLTDPRVTYWEPLKWITKLREFTTSQHPVLLVTNMSAGHGGVSGRFDHLRELALQYAFALACINRKTRGN